MSTHAMDTPLFTYEQLLEATGGQAAGQLRPFAPARVWTDTRTLQAGDFFLPLSGERFDGHDYLEQAIASGSIGAFVQRDKLAAHPDWQALPNLIAVASPVDAYLAVASAYRQVIDPLVVAVTGSSGKTTTKEMLAAALSPLLKTRKTEKNFNNEIGVSQTLLALTPDTEALVVEMGMRGLRQIAPLSQAACPDAALVINVGPAHIGMLGSLEAIAEAKLEIAEGLDPETGILVINGDDPQLVALAPKRWAGRLETYHLREAKDVETIADAQSEGVRFSYKDCPIQLSVSGNHMVANALGVLKLGESLGFPLPALAQGLSTFKPSAGRGEVHLIPGFFNVACINDAYNANPDSARASIDAFLQANIARRQQGISTKVVLIIGGMKELGDFSERYHRDLGRWLGTQPGIAALFTIGDEAECLAEEAQKSAASFPVVHAVSFETLMHELFARPELLQDSNLYLKGSRAYRLEELVERLKAATPPASVAGNSTININAPVKGGL